MRELSEPVTDIDWRFEDQGPLVKEPLEGPNLAFFRDTTYGRTVKGTIVSLQELRDKHWAQSFTPRRSRNSQGLDSVVVGTDLNYTLVSEEPFDPNYQPGEDEFVIEGLPRAPLPLAEDRPGLQVVGLKAHGGVELGVADDSVDRSVGIARGARPDGISIKMGGRDAKHANRCTNLLVRLNRGGAHELTLSVSEKGPGRDSEAKWGVAFDYGSYRGEPARLQICNPGLALKNLGLTSLELGEVRPMSSFWAPDTGEWGHVFITGTMAEAAQIKQSVYEAAAERFNFPTEPLNFAATGLAAYLNLGDVGVHPLSVLQLR